MPYNGFSDLLGVGTQDTGFGGLLGRKKRKGTTDTTSSEIPAYLTGQYWRDQYGPPQGMDRLTRFFGMHPDIYGFQGWGGGTGFTRRGMAGLKK